MHTHNNKRKQIFPSYKIFRESTQGLAVIRCEESGVCRTRLRTRSLSLTSQLHCFIFGLSLSQLFLCQKTPILKIWNIPKYTCLWVEFRYVKLERNCEHPLRKRRISSTCFSIDEVPDRSHCYMFEIGLYTNSRNSSYHYICLGYRQF